MIQKYALLKVIMGIIRERGEFTLRETARKLNISSSTTKRMLDYLLAKDIVEKRQRGKNHLFKIKQHYLARQIKILYSLSEIRSSGIVEELLEKRPEILSIILYGSVARGDDDDRSDIDILVITRKESELPELTGEQRINREVSFLHYTYTEWKKKAEKDRVFYQQVILNCIPLYGEKPVVL